MLDDSPDESESALDSQQWLLETSLGDVFRAYDEAREGKLQQPVVFVLDCEDTIGGEIARSWLGDEAVDQAIADRQSTSADCVETTVFVYAFPFEQCHAEVPQVFPYLRGVFEQHYPEDGFLAVSVTSGGASALTVPFSAREERAG